VPVGVPVTPPLLAIDQVTKPILASPLDFDLYLPVVLPVELERQAFSIPVVKIADQVNPVGPDQAGDLEDDEHFVSIAARSFVNHISSRNVYLLPV